MDAPYFPEGPFIVGRPAKDIQNPLLSWLAWASVTVNRTIGIETYEQPHTAQQTRPFECDQAQAELAMRRLFSCWRSAVGVFGACTSIDYLHITGRSVRQTTGARFPDYRRRNLAIGVPFFLVFRTGSLSSATRVNRIGRQMFQKFFEDPLRYIRRFWIRGRRLPPGETLDACDFETDPVVSKTAGSGDAQSGRPLTGDTLDGHPR
jgi:hypothetical protein